jgi:hypothetical protein
MLQWPLDAVVLQPDKWLKFNLVKKQLMSHNVVKLHFALPTPQSVLDWSSHWSAHQLHVAHLFCFLISGSSLAFLD